MLVFFIAAIGAAIFGNAFIRFSIAGISVFSIVIACGILYYFSYIIKLRKKDRYFFKTDLSSKFLYALTIWGLFYVGLSYLGVFRDIEHLNVMFNLNYIPRQAYYLFFLPIVVMEGKNINGNNLLCLVKKYSKFIFLAIYICHIVYTNSFALSVPTLFVLGLLLLMRSKRNTVIDCVMLIILLFSPISSGGETTQIILRILLLLFFISNNSYKCFKVLIILMTIAVCACFVIPFVSLDGLDFDANTTWRVQYWADEIEQLIMSKGLGVGYGTSYATLDFVGDAISGPFAESSTYSTAEKLFVVGCHNSFVSLAFRLGFIGLIFFILYFLRMSTEAKQLPNQSKYAMYGIVGAMVIICFNVGLENPTYFIFFALAAAIFHIELHLQVNEIDN